MLYNSNSLLFVLVFFFVILLLIIHLLCLYMYETLSCHTYRYAFGFVLKTSCDSSEAPGGGNEGLGFEGRGKE